MEEYYVVVVGLTPNEFWSSTYRQLSLYNKRKQEDSILIAEVLRKVEYTIAMWAGKMSKDIKKPTDLYLLPHEQQEDTILEGQEAANLLKTLFKPKTK